VTKYAGIPELQINESSQQRQSNALVRMIYNETKNLKKETIEILDFGAGTGHLAEKLNRKYNLTCLEVDENLVSKIEKKELLVIQKFMENKQFDLIYSSHVLEHIEDDVDKLAQLYKHLSCDGKIIIIVPLHMSLWTDMDIRIGHHRRYSLMEMKIKLESTQFEVEKLWNFDSLGFLIGLFLAKVSTRNIVLESKAGKRSIFLYDKLVLPLSLMLDNLTRGRFPGRNGFFVASKSRESR
jgi:SAM-dependent methyltransferase